jgi:hypothetical protein
MDVDGGEIEVDRGSGIVNWCRLSRIETIKGKGTTHPVPPSVGRSLASSQLCEHLGKLHLLPLKTD